MKKTCDFIASSVNTHDTLHASHPCAFLEKKTFPVAGKRICYFFSIHSTVPVSNLSRALTKSDRSLLVVPLSQYVERIWKIYVSILKVNELQWVLCGIMWCSPLVEVSLAILIPRTMFSACNSSKDYVNKSWLCLPLKMLTLSISFREVTLLFQITTACRCKSLFTWILWRFIVIAREWKGRHESTDLLTNFCSDVI